MSDTPRTDALPRIRQAGATEYVPIEDCRQLERELAEAREQRDTLTKAMTEYMDHLMRYGFVTAVENHKVEQALAAVKGGYND
jgi:hypothetical protein